MEQVESTPGPTPPLAPDPAAKRSATLKNILLVCASLAPGQRGEPLCGEYPPAKQLEWGVGSQVLWDTRPYGVASKPLSAQPKNISELIGRLGVLADERPKDLKEGIQVLYVVRAGGKLGIFLGLDITDETGRWWRYMYSLTEEELDFARRVIKDARERRESRNINGKREPGE